MIAWVIEFFSNWFIWVPLVLILAFLTYRNYKKIGASEDPKYDWTLLTLEIPRDNDKKELAAEQMFAALHGILRDKKELKISGGAQEHISFEIVSKNNQIRFFVRVPKHLQNFVEGQIYAQYPTVQIHEAPEDYAAAIGAQPVVATAELNLTDNAMLPIKTFQSFEVDPLAGITATLAKLSSGEQVWIQILARPVGDAWHEQSARFISRIKSGKKTVRSSGLAWLTQALGALWQPPDATTSTTVKDLSERDKTRIAESEKKSQKLGYDVKIRLAYLGASPTGAKMQMQAVAGAFKQFNSTNLNGFKLAGAISFTRGDLEKFTRRSFPVSSGFILNTEELASVFHLPHTNVETPNIVWASSKTAEPPTQLPVLTGDPAHDAGISAFGLTNFRGLQQQFGLYREDRSRHTYIIGQTGTGKSGLLELFALSDIFHQQGYGIIDPHGDFAIDNLKFIPPGRINDVVYFNPADTAWPLGFNPMEVYDPSQRNNISSEIIGVLKRMFENSWGPRLEYILRYAILALLEHPGSTLLDITRILTDKKFREQVLSEVKDTVVLNFWRVEFASWNDKFMSEAVAPILNKVGAFVANPIIRNIIGQPKSTFNIRQIMDEGKILIVNLSKGLIGEDNAAILGAFLVTKIQLAAMSRQDIPSVEDRRPFYLYVDEFQNFATDSFAVILSEARKYGLNLTVANQYVSQMSETVRDAVFGNVGTMISMRVSPEDAPILATQFAPNFEAPDILQMNNRHFVINMMIHGEKTPAFSGTTLKLPPAQVDYLPQIIQHTRMTYARPRADVEKEIAARMAQSAPTLPRIGQKDLLAQRAQLVASGAAQPLSSTSQTAGKKSALPSPSGALGSRTLGQFFPDKAQSNQFQTGKLNPAGQNGAASSARQTFNQTAAPVAQTNSAAQNPPVQAAAKNPQSQTTPPAIHSVNQIAPKKKRTRSHRKKSADAATPLPPPPPMPNQPLSQNDSATLPKFPGQNPNQTANLPQDASQNLPSDRPSDFSAGSPRLH
ncbi:MAG: type IV secretion system DNA-binding domain-containing protein [Candidatus Nomurabacteria bacterium]|jgi:hypothetical protein|nr:type IV secretion system DNA-binding domain-containing protein [Candidatus Nomurabacteria bacterium]